MARTYSGDVIDLTEVEFIPTTPSLDFIGEAPNGWTTVYRVDRSSAILVVRSERQRILSLTNSAPGMLEGLTGDYALAQAELTRLAHLICTAGANCSTPDWIYVIQGAILAQYAAIVAEYPAETMPTKLLWSDITLGEDGTPTIKPAAFAKLVGDEDPTAFALPSWVWIAGAGLALFMLTRGGRR